MLAFSSTMNDDVREHHCDLPERSWCRRSAFTHAQRESLFLVIVPVPSTSGPCVSRWFYPSSSPLTFCDFLPAFRIYLPLFFHHPVIGAPPTWFQPIGLWAAAAAWTLSLSFNFNLKTENREKRRQCRYCCYKTNPRSSQAPPTAKEPFRVICLAVFWLNIDFFNQLWNT